MQLIAVDACVCVLSKRYNLIIILLPMDGHYLIVCNTYDLSIVIDRDASVRQGSRHKSLLVTNTKSISPCPMQKGVTKITSVARLNKAVTTLIEA